MLVHGYLKTPFQLFAIILLSWHETELHNYGEL